MVHGMAKVEVAQNTAEAKEKIKATKFDLIYTDLNMGGYESGLINIIREKDKNVPVIAVTGNSYSSSNYMWNKGYSGYLLKTATDDRLIGGFIYTAIVYLDAKNRYYQVPETTGTIIMPIIVGNDDPNTNKKYVDGETVYGNDGFVYTYELKSQLFIRKGQPSKRYDRALSGANAGAFYEFPGYQPKDDMERSKGKRY
jgi:CheY-like chemotaxis protein